MYLSVMIHRYGTFSQQARLNGMAIDHHITETEDQDGEISRDLHENDFNSKLHDLLAVLVTGENFLRPKMTDYTNLLPSTRLLC